jgi:hypothetical protein
MQPIAFLPLPGSSVGALAAHGDRLLIARETLLLVDVSDPARPRVSASHACTRAPARAAATADTAYLAVDGALEVVALTGAPRRLAFVDFGAELAVTDVALSGEVLLITVENSLQAWSIAAPARPVKLGELFVELPRRITIAGPYAFVAADYNGVRVVDISDAARLREIGEFTGPGEVVRVALTGALALVADYSGSLSAVDVSRPARPKQLAKWSAAMVGDVDVIGARAFAATGALVEIDLARRAVLRPVATHAPPSGDSAWQVTAHAGLLFTLGERGLTIWR